MKFTRLVRVSYGRPWDIQEYIFRASFERVVGEGTLRNASFQVDAVRVLDCTTAVHTAGDWTTIELRARTRTGLMRPRSVNAVVAMVPKGRPEDGEVRTLVVGSPKMLDNWLRTAQAKVVPR